MWYGRRLDSIALADLETLLQDQVREGRSLDYKDEQPAHPQSTDKKGEFAADVSAMANGVGGVLIYGVAEGREDGRPTRIPIQINGLRGFVHDAEETRLRTFLENALDPRLPTGNLEFHSVATDGGPVLLVRVRRSYAGPHMVSADGRFRNGFYVRDGARNRNLDAQGVRDAVMASTQWASRFRSFRKERLSAILANESVLPLRPGGQVVLHIGPAFFDSTASLVDTSSAERLFNEGRLLSLRNTREYCSEHFNVDGLVVGAQEVGGRVQGYVQVFRSGILEIVEVSFVKETEVETRQLEQRLLEKVPMYFAFLQALDVPPPYVVGLALTGVRGHHHQEQRDIDVAREAIATFDRDVVELPDHVIDDELLRRDTATQLESILHSLWQAGGSSRCPRYQGGMYDPQFVLR